MKFRFDCVFYYVSDLPRAIHFYTDVLGFRLVSQDQVARFDVDGVLFELVPAPDPNQVKTGSGMCLEVEDMPQAVAHLESEGIHPATPEIKQGGILSWFQDPDGNFIFLWQYTGR